MLHFSLQSAGGIFGVPFLILMIHELFFKGFLGALMLMIAVAVVIPQYSDYRAAAQTTEWLAVVNPAKHDVAENAERSHSLVNSGLGVKNPFSSGQAPSFFEVTKDGTIFLQGGHEGQLVVLIPVLIDDKVSWRCIGGSRKATTGCNNAPQSKGFQSLAAAR